MTSDRTSADVSLQTLRLLWRAQLTQGASGGALGRPRSLSVDRIVQAAVQVSDEAGLDALTMRRLAADLGVTAMTLYTYVPNRTVLLDLMLDSVFAAMYAPGTPGPDPGRPWQDRVRQVAEGNRTMLAEHPWAAAVSTARPPLGPGQMAKYDQELRAFDGSGLTDLEVDDSLNCLLSFVSANALERAATERARTEDGRSDAEWWAAVEPLLGAFLDPATYPYAARIGGAAGAARGSAHDPEHAYRFGLDRLVAGFELLAPAHSR